MGPLNQLIGMLPGVGNIKKQLGVDSDLDDSFFKQVEAIIYSMTPEERRRPEIINGARKKRIARGSGTSAQEVNQLLKQFQEAKKIMKVMANTRGRGLGGMFGMMR
jgi:signal recognition particle subunit SRP54